jgi:hypothetical protein
MHKKFDIVDKAIVLCDKDDYAIDFYVNPDDTEKQNILKTLVLMNIHCHQLWMQMKCHVLSLN